MSNEVLKQKYAFHIKGCRDAMIDAGRCYIDAVLLTDAERLVIFALVAEVDHLAEKMLDDLGVKRETK